MKRRLIYVCLIVLVLSLSLCAVACNGGKNPLETSSTDVTTVETESTNTEAPETNAPETNAPETNAPETNAPETDAPETNATETNAPETNAPETDAPETDAPETNAPETDVPETDAPDFDLTIEEAIALVSPMANGKFTDEKYYVTGTVTSIFLASKGGIIIADDKGTPYE